MGNVYMQELQHNTANIAIPVKLEEVVNGVVHPVTKVRITKYKTLISDPPLFKTTG
jgi:hypothetical protein